MFRFFFEMRKKFVKEMMNISFLGNRLKRCQLFQNGANQAAADVLREVNDY